MAANTTGMRVEGTTISGTEHRGKRSFTPRAGAYGLVAALMVALMIGGAALHSRGGSPSSAVAIPRAATSAQTRFLENNTTNLPNAVSDSVVVPISRQRFLESNTTALPNANTTAAVPSVITSTHQQFLDVNSAWLPTIAADVAPSAAMPRAWEENTTMSTVCNYAPAEPATCYRSLPDGGSQAAAASGR